jgi:hypothetical protein
MLLKAVVNLVGKPRFQPDVLALDIAEFAEAFVESVEERPLFIGAASMPEHADHRDLGSFASCCDERAGDAPKPSNEAAPL